jgi:chemotaxis protein MotB
MFKGEWWKVLAAVVCVVPVVSGCVGLDQYKQLEMSNRTALAEKAQVESDLYDARILADGLRTKLDSAEAELTTKNQLVSNLQTENDRLAKSFESCRNTLEKLAGKGMSDPVVIKEEVKLPPALDSALKQFASQFPEQVEYNAKTGAVKWKADLLFDLGSDVVLETGSTSLAKFVEILRSPAAADFEVVVVGHTDDRRIAREATRQAHPTNWHLSVHRAIAVASVILKDQYDPQRIGVMGYGEYRPIAPNDNEENRSRNRRVEVYLIQRGSLLASSENSSVFESPELGLACAKPAAW